MAAETFLFNVNENRFFLGESKNDRFKKVCTYSEPPLDHLKIIKRLHRGYDISVALTPQRPGTFFGSNMCRCVFLPQKKKEREEKIVDEVWPTDIEIKSNVPEDCGTTVCSEEAVVQTGSDDFSDIESSDETKTTKSSKNKKKKKSKKKQARRRKNTKRDQSTGDGAQNDVQLAEIKCMLKKLLSEPNEEPVVKKKSSMRVKAFNFTPDECRKCSEKMCLRCKMHLDSCCCGIPNFLFCKDCEGKHKAPNCSNKDPFACRMCDQKLCLVCKQLLESCPCSKPNFLFCRVCDARMRTRCCIPGIG